MTSDRPARVRVLCVDDNAWVRQSLVMCFQAEEWLEVVGELPTADELARTVKELSPEIVLLDIDMPGRDSFEALQEMSQSHPNTRTIMMSGYIDANLIEKAMACGAWGYLSKSAGARAVVNAIKDVGNGEFVLSVDAAARAR